LFVVIGGGGGKCLITGARHVKRCMTIDHKGSAPTNMADKCFFLDLKMLTNSSLWLEFLGPDVAVLCLVNLLCFSSAVPVMLGY
jgi:hypothetical protein